MADICKGMDKETKMIGYADDVNISHKLPMVAEARLKKATTKVEKWTTKTKKNYDNPYETHDNGTPFQTQHLHQQ
jgi:hypothetical protein